MSLAQELEKLQKWLILSWHMISRDGTVVFCIAFTNAAADNIKEKVAEKVNGVPDNIKISTIHSFLYKELIGPY